jgi:putative OmpL-like beta-barrel porin-2
MRTYLQKEQICAFALLVLFSLAFCSKGLADDATKSSDSTKTDTDTNASTTAAKKPAPVSPAPGLTEREQWLLNRVEQLEKRVEELEAKEHAGRPSAAPAVATVAASGHAATPAGAAGNSAAPAITAAGNVASSGFASSVANVQPASTSSAQPKQDQSTTGSTSAAASEPQKPVEPFSDADWTWLNGNARTKDIFWDTKFFTPEIRADTHYVADFNHPTDHSMGGSSELFRTYEVQLEQLGVGGDFHYDNVRARLMTQFGMYSETTPRNDPSPGHGQWDLSTAYRYISEAYGGYHFNVLHGINVDAGIFMSYIGLFSYYNFDNWAYQPSYVSSNTPWFFNGVRVQIFPTTHLKIEPWFINGWQSYASANHTPGIGGQIKWTPKPWVNIISNNYGVGEDDLFISGRRRIHTDDSIEIKYYDRPENTLDKMAFSLTGDMGCEYGAGVSCYTNKSGGPKQSFIGYMFYNRFWFHRDLFGLTIGGGQINNPGRYLVLIPPINGETAVTAATNSPYFTGNPGDPFKAWDSSITFDYMPKQYITFRAEYDYRHANVPYWSGAGGITPPGGNNGFPQFYACSNGASSGQGSLAAAEAACGGGLSSVWFPDLRKNESFIDLAIMVKF